MKDTKNNGEKRDMSFYLEWGFTGFLVLIFAGMMTYLSVYRSPTPTSPSAEQVQGR